MKNLSISIIVTAYNSAKTIAVTLESIIAQTMANWEVIIVNDGSDDETVNILTSFATQDDRISIVNQQHQGVSVARNMGMTKAKFDWLLFIDAGDWIFPSHLQQLTEILIANSQFDVVYCGWLRFTSQGIPYGLPEYLTVSGDLFDILAEGNPFTIHGCIVRRSLVEAVGKFDPMLQAHEDWDLWQRIARTGACFGGTDEVLAVRVGFNFLSTNILTIFTEALQILTQGHTADPRVLHPHPSHAQGKSPDYLPALELKYACMYAGLAIGAGEDFRPIFAHLRPHYGSEVLSIDLIQAFLFALPIPTEHSLQEYDQLWQHLEQQINDFANALAERFSIPEFARRARLMMERAILEQVVVKRPVSIGSIYGVQIDIKQPILDFFLPISIERLHCTIDREGERLGILELPVFDGVVFSGVLSDAIASEFNLSTDFSIPPQPTNSAFEIPILMYHHIAPTGASQFTRWRVHPEAFEEQLRFLRDIGAYSITLAELRWMMLTKKPLPGRPIFITFDDGYLDFATYAWPLLKRYGFSATVFIVADLVGKSNSWDSVYFGEDLALLGWKQIKQLQAEGVEFGSHSLTHSPLTALSATEILREASQSQAIIERNLGLAIKAFAYPYGDLDPLVKYLIRQCGYDLGFSCRPGLTSFQDSLLQLPRLEIQGNYSLQEFIDKLFFSANYSREQG
ncbi:MAG TPA: glycosyltransferase [Nostocaceae cyanobacterium]|nr:glycosyltransferase [Nostocaceae cyanobacterium]